MRYHVTNGQAREFLRRVPDDTRLLLFPERKTREAERIVAQSRHVAGIAVPGGDEEWAEVKSGVPQLMECSTVPGTDFLLVRASDWAQLADECNNQGSPLS
jgi:hypothetical protein